ncbi:hypothetical protein LTR53_015711 [Teratosphaeriaceae sp. CCFEE 6253]|nr:hypothetical protein LTR53_015711 [Teratosphaeriaceae sp. CCFEE 6253]
MRDDSDTTVRSQRHISYMKDVLLLHEDQTEDALDQSLRNEAKELGLDPTTDTPEMKPLAKKPASSEISRRSQESLASQSTGFMSTFSDASRDQHHHGARDPFRSSLSFREYDTFIARGRPDGRNSISFSPPTTPSHSTLSLALSDPASSPKKHFRRIRGLSMLRLGRNSSTTSLADTCPHCPRDAQTQRRAVHKLPCGHRLCTQALRCNINAYTQAATTIAPSCCGVPIPGSLVEHVMTQAEQSALLLKLEQQTRRSGADVSHGLTLSPVDSHASPPELRCEEPRHDAEQQGKQKIELPEVTQLQREQTEQLERFMAWVSRQKAELEAQQNLLREQVKAIHLAALEELEDAHGAAMVEAEDKQVKAESDMRDFHDQERRDNATALKHMEAYCAGTYHSGELHNRPVTAQDSAELEKTRRTRELMDAKHESAINILRGEQGRRMRMRAQRQEREEQELRRVQRREELELERTFGLDATQLDGETADREQRLRCRWRQQTAIVAGKLAMQSNEPKDTQVQTPVPLFDWQLDRVIGQPVLPGLVEEARCDPRKDGISTGFAICGTAGCTA